MKNKLISGLLFLTLVALPLITYCYGSETTSGKWWDKLGTPEYGGSITSRVGMMESANFDPGQLMGHPDLPWFEQLFGYDWTVDREINPFIVEFQPVEYYKGILAERWEQTNPQTITVYLRHGIHWQDKSPLNGREFVADDVQYTYDRLLGTGSGFTEPNPFYRGPLNLIERVVATDKYTVEFRFKSANVFGIYVALDGGFFSVAMVAHELVEQDLLKTWDTGVGTGPWMPFDFKEGVSLTCKRNPDYWGYDERHPKNRLPYADTLKFLSIPDMATMRAAMRTGKIDFIPGGRGSLTWHEAKSLSNTNPEIRQSWVPNPGVSLELRVDHKPFTDNRVRQALQMSLDRKTIAQTHYGGTVDGTPAGLAAPQYKGWAVPYGEWPAELQAIYSYNPDRAKKLLTEAGYPDGFKTNCIVAATDDIELLEIIKAYFLDIGVDMDIQSFTDMPAFAKYAMAGKNDQIALSNTTGMLHRPDMSILRRTSNRDRENFTHNNDVHYDALVDQFESSGSLEDARKIYAKAFIYALEQCWTINVCPYAYPNVWQPWLKGLSGELMMGATGFYQARWWIDQDMKK